MTLSRRTPLSKGSPRSGGVLVAVPVLISALLISQTAHAQDDFLDALNAQTTREAKVAAGELKIDYAAWMAGCRKDAAAAVASAQARARVRKVGPEDVDRTCHQLLKRKTEVAADKRAPAIRREIGSLANALAESDQQLATMDPDPNAKPVPQANAPILVSMPDLTKRYPKAAAKAGAQGTTMVACLLKRNGRLVECQVAQSSGSIDLDAASLGVAAEMRFQSPVEPEIQVRVPVKWALQ